jgi:hypothetical protein
MKLARTVLAVAALAVATTAAHREVSAMPSGQVAPHVGGAWRPATIPADGPPSAAPSLAEWNAAREIDVTKSAAYHCETKVVREWFRATCVAYDKWILLAPSCKQSNGDSCIPWVDPSGKGQKASIVHRLRRGTTYKLRFVWNPGAVSYDLTIAVDAAGGAVASF